MAANVMLKKTMLQNGQKHETVMLCVKYYFNIESKFTLSLLRSIKASCSWK